MSQERPFLTGPMLPSVLAGAALGALVVALTTPKTGPELRGDLKDLAGRTNPKAGDLPDGAVRDRFGPEEGDGPFLV